jgi:hypothetical protein
MRRMNFFAMLFFFVLNCAFFAQNTVVLYDDFKDNANGWQEGRTAVSIVEVNKQRRMYVIKHTSKVKTEAWTAWKAIEIDENRDFAITASLYKESGVKNYGYGLLWGGKEQNYYSFLISPGGYYSIGKVVDGKWQNITNTSWISTPTVVRGNKAFNKLAVLKIDGKYYFEINGIRVATAPIGPFFGNYVGFNINNKQKILVDWIKVEYLN